MAANLDYNKADVLNTVKRNIRVLYLIVLLIVFSLILLNTRFLSTTLNYMPLHSVIILLLVVAGLIIGVFYLIKIISNTAIKKLEEFSDNIDTLLIAKQQEIIERKAAEDKLKKAHDKLEYRVKERTVELSKTVRTLKEQIAERKKTEKQLEHQAYYDQLTNLPNRLMFTKLLENVIGRAKQHKNYLFAVLFIDLDRFKVINDSLGHMIGDQLLIAAAQRFEACIRSKDATARLGGDEFAILLENIKDISEATSIADRLQKDLMLPFNLNGYDVFTTASIGIALSTTGYDRQEDILRDADSAMYRAKALGRARYELFDSIMHTNAMKLLQLEADLRRAIKRKEFLVHYQPIVSLTNGRISGAEALIRWKHPQRGLIPPMEFIPLAEETGLISTIGAWILKTACNQSKVWQNAGFHHLRLKVNFSARQFHYQDILVMIKRVIRKTRVIENFLDVEITESIATDNRSIILLKELSSMGIQISIDDFGTGYSSLGSLKSLPINTIKIDKSFVKDITSDPNAEGIVKAIIAMAHNLKINVVAEGVETEEQRAFLKLHHCDEMQGYLFSPPVPEKEFMKLLEKERVALISQN